MLRGMKIYLGIALVALGLSVATTASAASSPRLTLVARTPLTVHGTGFKPGELVTVSALVKNGARNVTVRAGIRGGFRATIRTVAQPCSLALAVKATGAKGEVAILRLPASICIPPPID